MTYTEQCVPLIRHIHCAMEKEANNKLREMDLTVSQIYLLQALNHAPDGTHTLTLKALEKQLQIGQSTTVGLVKRLQKKDFVTCTQSIDDKRIKIVALTAAGKNICCNAEAHMTHVFDHMSEGLSEMRKNPAHAFDRVQQNLIPHRFTNGSRKLKNIGVLSCLILLQMIHSFSLVLM